MLTLIHVFFINLERYCGDLDLNYLTKLSHRLMLMCERLYVTTSGLCDMTLILPYLPLYTVVLYSLVLL